MVDSIPQHCANSGETSIGILCNGCVGNASAFPNTGSERGVFLIALLVRNRICLYRGNLVYFHVVRVIGAG